MIVRLILNERREMRSLGSVDFAMEPRPEDRIEISSLGKIEAYVVTTGPRIFQIAASPGSMVHDATCVEVVRARR